jgi:hypothetical protein
VTIVPGVVGVLSLLLAALSPHPAMGQPNPPSENALVARVVALEAALSQQQALNASLAQRLADLEDKLAPLTRVDGVGTGTEWILTGVNLHVRNGTGTTSGTSSIALDFGQVATNGLGNVIVGYNENLDGESPRTGSHNVVLGTRNGYSSVAGIVGGDNNAVGGPGAVVLSGVGSDATGRFAVVVTGQDNEALGNKSLVASGAFNKADDGGAIFAGGLNVTFGPTTCAAEAPAPVTCAGSGIVLGGSFNKAGGGTVVSGIGNRVEFGGTIVGGIENIVVPFRVNQQFNGTLGVLVGGESNRIDGGRTPVLVGGHNATANANHAVVP